MDQRLLRSYKCFECNRDHKLSEVKCLEHPRSFTTHRPIDQFLGGTGFSN